MIQLFYFWIFIQRIQKILIQKGIATPIVRAALFTLAKIHKQPKCPQIYGWRRKMRHTQWSITHVTKHDVIGPF